jgi:hypothetical protein
MLRHKLLLSLLALSSQLFAFSSLALAQNRWIGGAAAVRQISTITVGGTTWADGAATLTVGSKSIVVTPVGSESEANVAIAIKEAIMSPVRLDGTGTTDATSNAGGQEFGEFGEFNATVSGNVVTLIANTAGVPFTISATENSTAGTLAVATPQAANGPWFWDNPKNWSFDAVPVDGDTVVFRDNDVPCRYNLPRAGVSSVEIIPEVHSTYTGEIGLRKINRTGQIPYPEYRLPLRVECDADGAGSTITGKFGIGPGPGSRLVKWRLVGDAALTANAIVQNTNSAVEDSERPLQLSIASNPTSGTITVHSGVVQLGERADGSDVTKIRVLGGDVILVENDGALTLEQAGGNVELAEGAIISGAMTLKLTGGELVARAYSGVNTVAATVENSKLVWINGDTIDTVEVRDQGIVDGEQDLTDITVTTSNLYRGASWFFGNGRTVTYTNPIKLNRTDLDGVKLRIGSNKQFTPAAIP